MSRVLLRTLRFLSILEAKTLEEFREGFLDRATGAPIVTCLSTTSRTQKSFKLELSTTPR